MNSKKTRPKAKNGEPLEFCRYAFENFENECIVWPYGKTNDGYGRVLFQGRRVSPHRLICFWMHGMPPTEEHLAIHSCHNPSCINPKHLSWGTPYDNGIDKMLKYAHLRSKQTAELIICGKL